MARKFLEEHRGISRKNDAARSTKDKFEPQRENLKQSLSNVNQGLPLCSLGVPFGADWHTPGRLYNRQWTILVFKFA